MNENDKERAWRLNLLWELSTGGPALPHGSTRTEWRFFRERSFGRLVGGSEERDGRRHRLLPLSSWRSSLSLSLSFLFSSLVHGMAWRGMSNSLFPFVFFFSLWPSAATVQRLCPSVTLYNNTKRLYCKESSELGTTTASSTSSCARWHERLSFHTTLRSSAPTTGPKNRTLLIKMKMMMKNSATLAPVQYKAGAKGVLVSTSPRHIFFLFFFRRMETSNKEKKKKLQHRVTNVPCPRLHKFLHFASSFSCKFVRSFVHEVEGKRGGEGGGGWVSACPPRRDSLMRNGTASWSCRRCLCAIPLLS